MTAILLLCLLTEIPGSLDLDPRRAWYTLETDHFATHFSSLGPLTSETESLACRVARLAEEVHNRLTRVTGWTTGSRTQIVVADFFDYANGWAAPLPDNTITIIPTPPSDELTNYDDWLRTLILHEYAHIIQMDMAEGLPAWLRRVFGRAILTNALQPIWLLEGYALQTETRFSGFGRARSAEYDMMIRGAADAGLLLPIDRCGNYELDRWPQGTAPYLYGGLFCRYVAEKHGTNVWDSYSSARSAGLPFFDNLFARRVFRARFDRLWRDWQADVVVRSDSIRRAVGQEPLTGLSRLTFERGYSGSPLWSRTGRELYYISRGGDEYPAIKAIDTATLETRVLHRGRVSGQMSLSPDGRRLVFSELDLSRYYDQSDIFALDLYTGEVNRLTRGMHARDPDCSPDSQSVVFVSSRDGRDRLMLLDLGSGETESLTEAGDWVGYSRPRFSPNGNYIAVAVNRPGGYADIDILDRRTGWVVPVTEDLANDLSPCWSRTGKHLFFVSDRSGIFNLYAYVLETQEITRCTNVLYGVFEPAVSPANRKLALVSYSPQGYDVAVTALDASAWQQALPFTDPDQGPGFWGQGAGFEPRTPISNPQSPSQVAFAPLCYYNPFPTVLPKLWLPYAMYDDAWSFGAFTFGWDALQFHRYVLAAGYRLDTGPFFALDYRLSRYLPAIGLDLDLDRALQAADLSAAIPFLTNRRSSQLGFLASGRRDSVLSAHYGLGFSTSTAFNYRFDVAPVEGAVWGLHTDVESKTTLGKRDRVRVLGYFAQFLGVGLGHNSVRRGQFPASDAAVRGSPEPGADKPPSAPERNTEHTKGNGDLNRRRLGELGVLTGELCGQSEVRYVPRLSLRLHAAAGTGFGDSSSDSSWVSYPAEGALGVRGFSTESESNRSIVAAGFQLRAPLCWPERGVSTAPVFLRNLNAALFAEWAMGWGGSRRLADGWEELRLGIGMELRADFVAAHFVPASIAVGCARGLRPEPGNQLYLRLASSMLDRLLVRPLERFDPAFLRD